VTKVLVVGDVIDDILVKPDHEIRFDTDTTSQIQLTPGGSAANFACWLANQQVEVEFVGRVNAKDLDRISADLIGYSVKPNLQVDDQLATGAIVVLVQGNQRTFLTDRGANKKLDVNQIEIPAGTKALYLSGYSLFGSLPEQDFVQLIARAKHAGLLVVLDPGSAGFINDFGVNRFLDVTAGVDLITPSLAEGKILTGEDRPELIANSLAERYPMVALTLGEEGVMLSSDRGEVLVPAVLAEVVDPTGAGDAFTAAMLANLLSGKDLVAAAKAGVKQGAIAVTLAGGRP
jgi:sugar/nucleoside kinase (ribokinase family)